MCSHLTVAQAFKVGVVIPTLWVRKQSFGEEPAQAHKARKEVGLGLGVILTEERGLLNSVHSFACPVKSREKSEPFSLIPVRNIPEHL